MLLQRCVGLKIIVANRPLKHHLKTSKKLNGLMPRTENSPVATTSFSITPGWWLLVCIFLQQSQQTAKSIFRSKCQKLKRLFYTLRNTIFNWNETRKPTDNTKESEIWKYMAQLHGNDNTGFSSFSVKYSRRIRSFRRIIFPRAWGIKGFNLLLTGSLGMGATMLLITREGGKT